MSDSENLDRRLGVSSRNTLSGILKKLYDWIVPPEVTSEEVSRKAKLMAKIVLSMVATNTIGFVAALFEPKNTLSVTVAFYGLVYAALIVFVVVLRHGKIKLAGWSLTIFMWCIIAFATLFFGGLRSQVPVVFVVVIMFMGSFLGGRSALILALMTIVFLGIVAFLEFNNLMPVQLGPEYSPLNAWGGLCVALLLMSLFLHNSLASIKESEERYQLAVRGSAAGLWDWDIKTNEVYYGRGLKEMLGYAPTEFPYNSATFNNAIHPEDLLLIKESLDKHFISPENRYDVEFRLRVKGGDYRWFHSQGEAVRDKHGKPYRMVGSITDITKRKLAEESITQKNEELVKINQELDRFVYSASHDLRAPITSLLGLIEVARLEDDVSSIKKLLTMQERSLIKLDSFIYDIVSYSRNNRVEIEIEKIDFQSLLDNIYDLFHHMEPAKGIRKETEIDPGLSFYSDKKRIYVVLNNLISNAIKYCDLSKPDSFIKIRIENSGNGVTLRVIDNGEGIEAEFIPKIFDMFYRASERSGGSGIGLYIVKEVVQKLQGTIEVSSQKYQGSEFIVRLPDMKGR
ncbi:PAS domain S-box protein [Chryseolinea soli]|uniref:histidine kinase n=2 Tax=Chryseolinea soli TaxID=2321403 RepID=A0A385SLP8_9BACT|nr:PAS domain S-box protein [Chryseolinea soli]